MSIDINNIITTDEFNNLLESSANLKVNQFKKRRVINFQPELLICSLPNEDRQRYLIKYEINCPYEERFIKTHEIGKQCWKHKLQISCIFICFESWVKKFAIDQPRSSRPIADYEDKEERFCIIGQSIDQKTNAVFFKIERPDKKRIMLIEPVFYKSGEQTEYSKFYSDFTKSFYKGYFEEVAKKHNL